MFDYYLKTVFRVRVIQQSDIVEKFLKLDKNDELQNNHYSNNNSMTNSVSNGLPSNGVNSTGESLSKLNVNENNNVNGSIGSKNSSPEANKVSPVNDRVPSLNQHTPSKSPLPDVDQNDSNESVKTESPFTQYFDDNSLPIVYYTPSGPQILTYKISENKPNPITDDCLNFTVSALNISKDLVSLHCELFSLYKIDQNYNKFEKLFNDIKVTDLIESKTPVMFSRWGKIDVEKIDEITNNCEEAKELLLSEFKYGAMSKDDDIIAENEIESCENFGDLVGKDKFGELANNFTFLPCTCDLRWATFLDEKNSASNT